MPYANREQALQYQREYEKTRATRVVDPVLSAKMKERWSDPTFREKMTRGRWPSAEDRFWNRVTKTETCWLFRPVGKNGYGYMTYRGKHQPVHRVAYQMLVGPIPAGLEIDHLCRNRSCVNPAHLEPVTRSENNRRGDGPMLVRNLRTRIVELEEENADLRGRLAEYVL